MKKWLESWELAEDVHGGDSHIGRISRDLECLLDPGTGHKSEGGTPSL